MEPSSSRRYQGCRLLPTTMILIAYSRANEDRAGDVGPETHRDAAELLGQLEVLAEESLGGRVDPGEVFGGVWM